MNSLSTLTTIFVLGAVAFIANVASLPTEIPSCRSGVDETYKSTSEIGINGFEKKNGLFDLMMAFLLLYAFPEEIFERRTN